MQSLKWWGRPCEWRVGMKEKVEWKWVGFYVHELTRKLLHDLRCISTQLFGTWRFKKENHPINKGFLSGSVVKNPPANAGGFDPWSRKIPWSRKWQPSPVFLSGKSNGQRNLVGYSPSGHRFGHDWSNTHTQKPSCTKLTWVAHLKLLAIVKAKNPFSSVQFSLSVISNFSRPHEPQQARPPCPSPTPRIYSN